MENLIGSVREVKLLLNRHTEPKNEEEEVGEGNGAIATGDSRRGDRLNLAVLHGLKRGVCRVARHRSWRKKRL